MSRDAAGNILVDGAKTSLTVPSCTTSVDATVANTTQINVNGTPGATLTDDGVTILTYLPTGATASFGSINWTVNLGDNGALPLGGDQFAVDNSGNTDNATETDWGANGVDLTGDGEPGCRAGRRREVDRLRLNGHGPDHRHEHGRHRQCRWLDHHRCGLPDRHHDRRLVERHYLSVPDGRRRQRHAHRQWRCLRHDRRRARQRQHRLRCRRWRCGLHGLCDRRRRGPDAPAPGPVKASTPSPTAMTSTGRTTPTRSPATATTTGSPSVTATTPSTGSAGEDTYDAAAPKPA